MAERDRANAPGARGGRGGAPVARIEQAAQSGEPNGATRDVDDDVTSGAGAAGGTRPASGDGLGKDWIAGLLSDHRNAVLLGVCGLLCASLILWLGLLRALLIVVLVFAGVTVGQALDGDPKILRVIQRMLKDRK